MADAPPPDPRHPPWSDLQADLLHLISQRLALIFDYISFRSVCRSWRSAADPQSLPSQSPLLMIPYDPGLEFFSLDSRRLCNLDLPEDLDTRCLASNHGWLLVLPTHPSVFLLNPFTGARIPLPPFIIMPGAPPLAPKEVELMAFVSSSPAAGDDCVVMVWLMTTWNFAFCRPRDKSWTEINIDRRVMAMAYCDNNFYAIDFFGSVFACDVSVSPPRVWTIPVVETFPLLMRCCKQFYLVGSAAGLLLVEWYTIFDSDDDDDDGEDHFDVFKMMDAEGAAPRWEEIKSLDGEALFLCNGQGYSVRATDCPGVRPNCIYCSETNYPEGHHVTVFSIEDASFELIECYPDNDHYWNYAAWLRPSLH